MPEIDEEKKMRIEKTMEEMKDHLNKDLDEKVASGEIDEHEARDRYFHFMMLTLLIAK